MHEDSGKILVPSKAGIEVPMAVKVPGADLPPGFNEIGKIIRPALIGQISKPEKLPIEILVPKEDEVQKYGGANPDQERKTLNQSEIFFLTNRWGYLNNRLNQANIEFPINLLQDQVSQKRAQAREIPQHSLILLKSIKKDLREAERERLLQNGFSEFDLMAALSPDLALINVADQNLIEAIKDDSEPMTKLSGFLNQVIDELLPIDSPDIQLVAELCAHLNILMQLFLYKTGRNQLNLPEILEKISHRLEFLSTDVLVTHKHLNAILDFVSFFEMNNANASQVFLQIIQEQNSNHPLAHELTYQLEPDNRTDNTQPKVGMEIEAFAMVIFGQIPEGFSLGSDNGSFKIPELRRSENFLPFDNTYRRQLFQLWHFARLTQLRGLSLHLHFDDPNKEVLNILYELFGNNSLDVRTNNKKLTKTVELRLNLSNYRFNNRDKAWADLRAPFFLEQYNVVPFIVALINIINSKDQKPFELNLNDLPSYWQAKLRKKSTQMIDFEELIKLVEKANWDWEVLEELLDKFTGTLTLDQVTSLSEKASWDWDVVIVLLDKLADPLTLDQVTSLSEKASWKWYVLEKLLDKFTGTLTLDQVTSLAEKAGWRVGVLEILLDKFTGTLTLDQFTSLAEKAGWNWDVLKKLLNKLTDPLTLDQVTSLAEKVSWYLYTVRKLLDKFTGTLTLDQVTNLAKKTNWDWDVLEKLLDKFTGTLTLDQVTSLAEKAGWNWDVLEKLLDKFTGTLTLDQVTNLAKIIIKNNNTSQYLYFLLMLLSKNKIKGPIVV